MDYDHIFFIRIKNFRTELNKINQNLIQKLWSRQQTGTNNNTSQKVKGHEAPSFIQFRGRNDASNLKRCDLAARDVIMLASKSPVYTERRRKSSMLAAEAPASSV